STIVKTVLEDAGYDAPDVDCWSTCSPTGSSPAPYRRVDSPASIRSVAIRPSISVPENTSGGDWKRDATALPRQSPTQPTSPNAIDTPMIKNEATYKLFRPDLDHPTQDDAAPAFGGLNPMGVPFIDPVQVSNAVLFLASDESLYVSGARLPVDAGASVQA
ncbi:MAG: hypothetical protein ACRDQA_27475, partial [Nocardioidaceae bacterium]